MKTTKELARELGLLRKRYISTPLSSDASKTKKHKANTGQIFSYLVVLDFESTCWQDGKYRTQEIIEFPAVLCNTQSGQIESEFQYYVQPHEQPVLSDFCKQLTGISQEQVEQGIPLSLCLRKFSHWLNQIKREKNIIFEEGDGARATFVTWSDWDLGVCLLYEARRKQLTRPPEMNSWIDLRATYRKFYGRKPHGLNGALQDVGIKFKGREHSGVDDARNTARLAWRMMRDGCIMNITKNIHTGSTSNEQQMTNPMSGKNPEKGCIAVFSDEDTDSTVQESSTARHSRKVLRQTKLQPVKCSNTNMENSKKGLRVRDGNKIPPSEIHHSKCDGGNEDSLRSVSASSKMTCSTLSSRTTRVTPTKGPCKGKGSSSVSTTRTNLSESDPSGISVTATAGFKTPNQSVNHGNSRLSVSNSSVKKSVGEDAKSITVKSGSREQTPNQNSVCSVFKTPSPLHDQGSSVSSKSGMKATPPMCKCGRRSKRRMVQSPGPNLGRFFFTCGVRTSQYDANRGCSFFQWESPPSGGHNSGRHVSKTGSSMNVSKPFTPVLNMNFGSTMSQSKRQLGVRSAVPKFIR